MVSPLRLAAMKEIPSASIGLEYEVYDTELCDLLGSAQCIDANTNSAWASTLHALICQHRRLMSCGGCLRTGGRLGRSLANDG